jgi:hypothetical protein
VVPVPNPITPMRTAPAFCFSRMAMPIPVFGP